MKKLLLCFSYIFLSFIYISTAKAEFVDVSTNSPYYDAVNYLQTNGIVEGYTPRTINPNIQEIELNCDDNNCPPAIKYFQPSWKINRAEFMKIISKIQNNYQEMMPICMNFISINKNSKQLIFPDVNPNEWYAPFVCLGYLNKLVKGYPDNTFKPANTISFVEAAKIITTTIAGDIPEGNPWYKPYVEYMSNNNAIPTSITRLDKYITRAEIAEMIYRLKLGIKDKESQNAEFLFKPRKPTNKYDFFTLQVGDHIGGMVVTDGYTASITGGGITLEGDIRIKGKYTSGFCFVYRDLDENSKKLIPKYWPKHASRNPDYYNNPGFCFQTDENYIYQGDDKKLKSIFGRGINTEGFFDITINKYIHNECMGKCQEKFVIIKKIHSIAKIPTSKNECIAKGGKWDASDCEIVCTGYTDSNELLAELRKGYCFMPKDRKYGKIFNFDDCRQITEYNDQNWFNTLKNRIDEYGLTLKQISDSCYSNDGNILLIIAKSDSKKSGIYRFDIKNNRFEKVPETDDLGASKFGKREGSNIYVSIDRVPSYSEPMKCEDGKKYYYFIRYDYLNNSVNGWPYFEDCITDIDLRNSPDSCNLKYTKNICDI